MFGICLCFCLCSPRLSVSQKLNICAKKFRIWFTWLVMARNFDNFEFQVCFLTGSREELLMFYLSKMIWCFRLAQSNLKIILSKRQCVPLLHAWWIYVKHSKRAEHAETGKFQRKNKSNNQRPRNLKNREGDFFNFELTIISVLFISHSTWTRQSLVKYTQRFTEAGAASYWKHCSS